MDNFVETLSRSGHRVTRPRKAVATVLAETDVPLSASEILALGQAVHTGLGLVTVYRTLELYEGLGLVCRVHLRQGCHGYLATTPDHRHMLLCQRCGRFVEFSGRDALDELVASLERSTGYRVHDHLLQLVGLCPACRETDARACQPVDRTEISAKK